MTNTVEISSKTQSTSVTERTQTTGVREIDLQNAFLYIRTNQTKTIESNTTMQRRGGIMEASATLVLQQNSTKVIA